MPRYSVATTKDKLSTLIDKALAGEEVIVTRHGEAIVEIRPIQQKNEAKRRGWAWYQAKLDQLPEIANNGEPLMRQIKDEYRF
jgi:prevent-host-death family protein